MARVKLFAVVVVLLLLIGVIIVVTSYGVFFNQSEEEPKQFYVGVTYCGSSVQEAKELVDQVKDYTNLFGLLSGTVQTAAEVNEIGDYVVASGLNFIVYTSYNVYYSADPAGGLNEWANAAKERWQENFIGIYYRDEPGGDLLDGKLVTLEKLGYDVRPDRADTRVIPKITKYQDVITVYARDPKTNKISSLTAYGPDGGCNVTIYDGRHSDKLEYLPNGTLIIHRRVWDKSGVTNIVYTAKNITEYPSYEEVLKQNPIKNNDDIAKAYINMNKAFLEDINKKQLNSESILVFTADYGLYWWNYQGGYDVVFAELAWNNTAAQEIGLVRGAANLQGKSWGTILTWKYTHPPYLTDGAEMFEQIKASYEAGAEYVLIFNYTEDPTNHNTLQEEHYEALERFWNDVVQNPKVVHGGIKAEAVFVLPQNYGWGMRFPEDNLWGLWYANEDNQELWNQIQNKLDKHGLKLDIVFEDPNHPIKGKYNNIYYWNQK